MIEALKNIPANIWSVLLGSLIAFLGVLISNIHNNKRLKIQLKHDSEIRSQERKISIRREVYLRAAEELVKANGFLGSLSQMDIAKTDIGEGLQGLFASTAKLGLVAEEQTGKATNDLVLAYNALFFRLLIKASPISDLRNRIKILNYHYDDSQSEIKRILAAMTSQNESGFPDKVVFDSLNNTFSFQNKRSEELTSEMDVCWKKINKLTAEFAIYVAQEMKSIALLQVPVLVGIRKELEFEASINTYSKRAVSNAEQLNRQLDEFISAVEKSA